MFFFMRALLKIYLSGQSEKAIMLHTVNLDISLNIREIFRTSFITEQNGTRIQLTIIRWRWGTAGEHSRWQNKTSHERNDADDDGKQKRKPTKESLNWVISARNWIKRYESKSDIPRRIWSSPTTLPKTQMTVILGSSKIFHYYYKNCAVSVLCDYGKELKSLGA